jgi:hypothetical protein
VIRWALVAALASTPALAADPYDALKAMDGHWRVTTGTGRTETLDNACSRTGLFFVCEETIQGKPTALVVFRPQSHKEVGDREEGKLAFRVQTLTAGADRPGPWKDLVIDGTTWTISDADHPGGRKTRTVITHSGPDYMHVEVQAEGKGDAWAPVSSESFTRR